MIVLLWRVVGGFVRRPVDRPLHRWVIVTAGPDASAAPSAPETEAGEVPRGRRRIRGGHPGPGTGGLAEMSPGAAEHGKQPFVVAHRGASAERPEHTLAAYELALQEGADGVEVRCAPDRDGHLVCVHDRRADRTSSGTGLVSDLTLAELREFDWGAWHASWRHDGSIGDTSLLTLEGLLQLVLDWQRPVKVFIETKHPVRYGALVESKVLALLHRYGTGRRAGLGRSVPAVVMSFSAAAVGVSGARPRCCPPFCWGDVALSGGGAATTVGATAVGPSIRDPA